jgi:hypothetical protein
MLLQRKFEAREIHKYEIIAARSAMSLVLGMLTLVRLGSLLAWNGSPSFSQSELMVFLPRFHLPCSRSLTSSIRALAGPQQRNSLRR